MTPFHPFATSMAIAIGAVACTPVTPQATPPRDSAPRSAPAPATDPAHWPGGPVGPEPACSPDGTRCHGGGKPDLRGGDHGDR